jgi:hypothetical protein
VNPSQKRKAVEEALLPFVAGRKLANALILWDEKYAHQPTFALQHFLRELCSDLEIAHLRSRMLQSLVSAFSALQDNRQSRVAPRETKPSAIRPAAANVKISPILSLFMDLVNQLIEAPGGDTSTRIRLYVLDNLEKISLPTQERWAFQSWLNQIAPLTGTTPNINIMQQIINLTYVALCEYLGPIKADQILQNTVSLVQKAHPNTQVQSLL